MKHKKSKELKEKILDLYYKNKNKMTKKEMAKIVWTSEWNFCKHTKNL